MEIAALEEGEKNNRNEPLQRNLKHRGNSTLQSKRLPGINENLDEKTLRWLELSEIEG